MQCLNSGVLLQNGKYKIEKALGQGGFGITYVATQDLLERKVCIKEFFFKDSCSRSSTGDVILGIEANRNIVERFLNKFIKEARTLSNLDHPHIIRIFDIFKENNTAYYVMDYIEGSSLEDIIKDNISVTESNAVRYITQVAGAIDYIHQRSINHLDIKPGNIMIRKSDNQAILIDFGVSKQYDSQGEQTSTTPVGISYGYAPIEQYRPGGVSEFSPQSDIYALGATLYKLLTGKTPPQAIEILYDGITGIPSSVAPNLRTAIEKAMQVKKNDRPQNIKEFLDIITSPSDNKNNLSDKPSDLKKPSDESIDTIVISNPNINGHEYVDLGLPSGLKWATCNIGAHKPEEYGKYFAWGEEITKGSFTKDNCKTVKCRFFGSIVERNGNFIDTAKANWGETWRMPSNLEFQELITNCKWSWIDINGVKGMKVTGPNGNWIFLPAAGYYHDTTWKELDINGIPYGSYWSLTAINSDYGRADSLGFGLNFQNNHELRYQIYSSSCYEGHSIRPVSK
jgi:serine/threonine protein kinase